MCPGWNHVHMGPKGNGRKEFTSEEGTQHRLSGDSSPVVPLKDSSCTALCHACPSHPLQAPPYGDSRHSLGHHCYMWEDKQACNRPESTLGILLRQDNNQTSTTRTHITFPKLSVCFR